MTAPSARTPHWAWWARFRSASEAAPTPLPTTTCPSLNTTMAAAFCPDVPMKPRAITMLQPRSMTALVSFQPHRVRLATAVETWSCSMPTAMAFVMPMKCSVALTPWPATTTAHRRPTPIPNSVCLLRAVNPAQEPRTAQAPSSPTTKTETACVTGTRFPVVPTPRPATSTTSPPTTTAPALSPTASARPVRRA